MCSDSYVEETRNLNKHDTTEERGERDLKHVAAPTWMIENLSGWADLIWLIERRLVKSKFTIRFVSHI